MDPRGEVDAFGSYSSSASEVVRGSFSGRQKPVKDVGHHESEHRPKLCVGQFSSRGASEMVRICFNRAIINWNETLLKNKSEWNKFYIDLDANGWVDPTVTAQSLVHAATTARDKYAGNDIRKKSKSVYDTILLHLNRYARSIDVIIQTDPTVSSLIWGPVRALLEVASDSMYASDITADGIRVVVEYMGMWDRIAALSGRETSVCEALTHLYFRMLGFLMPAIDRFLKSPMERFASSFCRNEREQFDIRLRHLKEASEKLQWEAQIESNENSRRMAETSLNRMDSLGRELLHRAVSSEARLEEQSAHTENVRAWIGGLALPINDSKPGLSAATIGGEQPPWILIEPQVQDWLSGNISGALRVTGQSGIGKSNLARRSARYLKCLYPPRKVISCAFQSNYSAAQRSPIALAFSILDHILGSDIHSKCRSDIASKLSPYFSRHRQHPDECPFQDIWNICVDALKKVPDFILVIDGLNECQFLQKEDGPKLMANIDELCASTSGRAIIFCQPSFVLRIGTTPACGQNEIRITPDKTAQDLNDFCKEAANELPWDDEYRQDAFGKATAGAHGSFQWATLLFKDLATIRHTKDIKSRLDTKRLPSTCHDFYKEALDRLCVKASKEDRQACRDILLVLLVCRRILTLRELADAAGLIFARTGPVLLQWLQMFVAIVGGRPVLTHASVRDFFLEDFGNEKGPASIFLKDDPESFMARRCLECLLEEKYGRPSRIARRLRSSFKMKFSDKNDEDPFYRYAAENWDMHLTQIRHPKRDLLKLVGEFLSVLQFSYWAEYSYKDSRDFQAIRITQTRLVEWSKKLTKDERDLIKLDGYYEVPYKNLNHAYEETVDDDKTLPWLALMRLGFYYFDVGRIDDMERVQTHVAESLCELLGKQDPLTLQARSEAAYAQLHKGNVSEARNTYKSIATDQREIMPEGHRTELYWTLFYQGLAEYLLNEYPEALHTLASVSAGFLSIEGPEGNGFLCAEIYYAQVNAAKGAIEQAIDTTQTVRKKREELYGSDDGFATLARTFLSDLYRKHGSQERSLSNIQTALKLRKRLFRITHPLVIDASLRLAIVYRDFDLEHEAWEVIDRLEDESQLEGKDKFYELCQTQHIKALLLFGDGETDRAISILQSLLINTDPEQVNRPLQWIRLDLADILRYRQKGDDKDTAKALFDGVVVEKGADSEHGIKSGEPDPPKQLEIAEKALRLFRKGKMSQAQALLEEEGFEWSRERSLWLPLGMPAADTTVMKPPRGLGEKKLNRENL